MNRPILLGSLLSLAACHSQSTHAIAESPAAADRAMATIDAASLAGSIRLLSSDLFEGRGPGSRGDELARAYIQSEFERSGLEPAAADGSWEQKVPILGITSKVTQPLMVTNRLGDSAVLHFDAPTDYTAVAGSDSAEADWKDAGLVFVGYGIHAPEQDWDDYGDVDLTGKVLLVMNNDPSTDPALFAGKTRLYYGRWSYKFEEAARRGAVGAIVIHTTPSAGYPFQVIQQSHGRENFWLPFDKSQPTLPIRSWCSEEAARKMCALAGQDLDALRARAERRDFQPVPLMLQMRLGIANDVRRIESANVLGKLPGSDPAYRDEHVYVTAHFDHLGIAAPKNGDAIYNGALDNGTGTAALMTLARACAHLHPRPARTIVFAAVTAEESGLLGSKFLAANLPVPRRSVVANYNIDGLNIWGETMDIEFIGYGKSSLTALAERIATAQGRRLKPDTNPDLGLFYRSDHFSFARQGIPAAYFKAGNEFLDRPDDRRRMKASYTAVHYHQPSDEMAPWWNLAGAVADLRLLLACLAHTAGPTPEPTWTPGDEFEKAR